VFTVPDGRPVPPSVASHTFVRRVRALALPPVRLHDLRHGAASLNFAAHDLKAVQALLGHSSPVTTAKIYTDSRELHQVGEKSLVARSDRRLLGLSRARGVAA